MEKVCPKCGYKLSQYLQTGYLGCDECYNSFRHEIENTLKKVQGGVYHVGKIPNFNDEDKELLDKYRNLQKEKEKAVMSGHFLEMNKLSQQITELYNNLKERGLI